MKVAKPKARLAWKVAILLASPEHIIRKAAEYSEYRQSKAEDKYTQLPANWLESEAWENDIPKPPRTDRMSADGRWRPADYESFWNWMEKVGRTMGLERPDIIDQALCEGWLTRRPSNSQMTAGLTREDFGACGAH